MFIQTSRYAAPLSIASWPTSFAMQVGGTITDNDNVGRWGLFLALISVTLSATALARTIIIRLTQVLGLFYDDVHLIDTEHPPARDPATGL